MKNQLTQGVKFFYGKVKHDPLGHEVEAVVALSREDWQPDAHPVRTAVQPQRPESRPSNYLHCLFLNSALISATVACP